MLPRRWLASHLSARTVLLIAGSGALLLLCLLLVPLLIRLAPAPGPLPVEILKTPPLSPVSTGPPVAPDAPLGEIPPPQPEGDDRWEDQWVEAVAPQAPVLSPSEIATPTSAPQSRRVADAPPDALEPEELVRPGLDSHTPPRSVESRRSLAERFGGSARTETAVDLGLAWLAAHQSLDGAWRRSEFLQRCPVDDVCGNGPRTRLDASLDVGLTGLVLLSFTGAGFTDREGPYQPHVAAAVETLLAAQAPDGGFSPDEAMAGYNDSLATFALSELYSLTRDPRLEAPLRRAVDRLARSQQLLGGWDYRPRAESGRNDTSISAWCVQALQAAAAAGIPVPRTALIRAALHFSRATEADGRVWYADQGNGFRLDPASLKPVYRYGAAMTAAGLTCGELLGCALESDVIRRQRALLLAEPPSAAAFRGRDATGLHSEYYWYYGTVAMFQAGGEHWERWNAALRDAILPLQDREQTPGGRRRHRYGSWQPYGANWGKWGRMGGRVYTTAISVLTLETYYRHTPAYLQNPAVLTASDWCEFLEATDARQRRLAVDTLARMRLEIGEPPLAALLDSGEPQTAFAAAAALAQLGSPVGRRQLELAAERGAAVDSATLRQALDRCRELAARPAPAGTVRRYDTAQRLATLDLEGAYFGLVVEIRRTGERIAEMRVIRRFSGRPVVVAELVDADADQAPKAGDEVVARP